MAVPVGSRWKAVKQLDKEELQEFGQFLLKQRTSIGYSSVKMAELLGVHRTSYRRWERGMHVPHGDIKEIKQDIIRIVDYVKRQKEMGKAV
ncbi:multiprotein-bridging factor 1 family protein [Peribacillus asahii]|uniref:helix-turn-helix domain-containing protein n=1 Tax=Peribacillus asahii TaxID=228899 RepID=UPI0037F4A447